MWSEKPVCEGEVCSSFPISLSFWVELSRIVDLSLAAITQGGQVSRDGLYTNVKSIESACYSQNHMAAIAAVHGTIA